MKIERSLKMKRLIGIVMLAGIILCSSASAGGNVGIKAKSPGTATALSLFGTMTPLFVSKALSDSGDPNTATSLLVLGGLLMGPGIGHMYAGNEKRFWGGFGLRLAGLAGMTLSFAASWNNPDSDGAAVGFLAGSVVYLGSTIHDIATADNSVRDYNKKYGLTGVSIAPTYFASQNAPGLQLAISF
jgi:hypothetical protein